MRGGKRPLTLALSPQGRGMGEGPRSGHDGVDVERLRAVLAGQDEEEQSVSDAAVLLRHLRLRAGAGPEGPRARRSGQGLHRARGTGHVPGRYRGAGPHPGPGGDGPRRHGARGPQPHPAAAQRAGLRLAKPFLERGSFERRTLTSRKTRSQNGFTMATRRAMLIAGRWMETGTTSPIRNPYNGEVLAEVCLAGESEADEVMRAAVAAFAVSRKLPAHVRSVALQKIAGGLTARKEDFARCLSSESGKPITDARREIGRAIITFTVAAEETKRIPGEIVPLDITPGTDNHFGLYRRGPIGPMLGITPFNFPLNLVAHNVAPALAVGNPIVLKPAPQTPLTCLMLGEAIRQPGLPAGMVSILPCTNAVAERMVTDERFKLVSFTGSAAVGWMLKNKAGKKRVVLELGGDARGIVEPRAALGQ